MRGKRKIIKARIAEILSDNADKLGLNKANIFTNRVRQITDAQLPAIILYTGTESATDIPVKSSNWEYKLQVSLNVDCIVKAANDVETAAEDFTEKVCDLLARNFGDQDNQTGAVFDQLVYRSYDLEMDDEGAASHATGRLVFDVIYYAETEQDTPGVFERAAVDYEVKIKNYEGGGTAKASDTVDIPQ